MTTALELPQSALAIAALLRDRELSAVELCRHYLDVIAARNPELWAFVAVSSDRALAQARAADTALRSSRGPLPRFLGLPTGIKDNDHVRGHFTQAGSRALKYVYAPADGLVARTCRRAGFTLFGKLASSELTILPIVDHALHPPTRNPIAPQHYAGGSSGGSASAVAAGMVPIAPGSDGGGSIRIPASFCGLVGHKATRGALPNPYGAFDRAGISAIGPIAHTVRDAGALLDALAGRTHDDAASAPGSFLAACDAKVPRLRVRLWLRTPLADVDPEAEARVRAVARLLEELGHHVEEGGPPEGTIDEFIPLMARMVANVPLLPWTERLLGPSTQWMRSVGKKVKGRDATALRLRLERGILDWFGDADVWLSPTIAAPPPKVGAYAGLDGERLFREAAKIGVFTAPFNVSGQPAISVPAGRTEAGLPIGVQLIGRMNADRLLLGLAAELEARLRDDAS